jgi:hypothetical protein
MKKQLQYQKLFSKFFDIFHPSAAREVLHPFDGSQLNTANSFTMATNVTTASVSFLSLRESLTASIHRAIFISATFNAAFCNIKIHTK